jgi:ABC-2 type transport system permease protein
MKSWIVFVNILLKDVKNYYLKPPNISWGIIFPISWTLMFLLRSETPMDIREILPGIIAMSVLFGTTSMLAVTITFEKKSKSFDRLLIAPISLNLLMIAKTTGAIVFGMLNAIVPVVLALFWASSLNGIDWFIVFLSVFLIALTSAFLGLLVAVSVSEVFEAQTLSNFFRFPMLFLCGLYFPITKIPAIIRPLSYIMPLTYGVDALKNAINKDGLINPTVNFLALIGFAVMLFAFSIKNVRRKWIL